MQVAQVTSLLGSTVPAPGTAMQGAASAPAPPSVPGPELPAVPPRHPALPNPVPSLAELARRAASAPAEHRFMPGAHPSTIRNAHYANTRAQLAFALAGPYNSFEGDVRMQGGVPMMVHDTGAAADLTFEQWALLVSRAGRHLRIDVKEAAALPRVSEILERLGVDSTLVTFNVGVRAPWSTANLSIEQVRALRERFPGAWVTLNLPLPLGPGYVLAARAARQLGPERLGVAITSGLAHAADVRVLRRHFAVVNAWNLPQLGNPDIAATSRRLRAMGVNGMIDLRRREDPLADD